MAALAIAQGMSSLSQVWENELDVVKSMIGAADLDDNEFKAFCAVAKNVGLNPLARQIYAIPFRQKVQGTQDQWRTRLTIVTGIDGYRTIAERSGIYAGQDEAEYGPTHKVTYSKDVWTGNNKSTQQVTVDAPSWAKVTVYKVVAGVRCPFTAKVLWSEYFPENKPGRWTDMPFHMLAKCAEANALRKAFPNDLSGLFTDTETDRMHSLQPAIPMVDLNPDGSVPNGAKPGAGVAAPEAQADPAADALAEAATETTTVIEAQFSENPSVAAQAPIDPSADQRAMFFALWHEIGGPGHTAAVDKQVNYGVWGAIIGRDIDSWTKLDKGEVHKLIDWMNAVKEGKKKAPNFQQRRDAITGQAVIAATAKPVKRGVIEGFKGLCTSLPLNEDQASQLLTEIKGDFDADDKAVAGWLRGLSTFDDFLALFSDPFDELPELKAG